MITTDDQMITTDEQMITTDEQTDHVPLHVELLQLDNRNKDKMKQ